VAPEHVSQARFSCGWPRGGSPLGQLAVRMLAVMLTPGRRATGRHAVLSAVRALGPQFAAEGNAGSRAPRGPR